MSKKRYFIGVDSDGTAFNSMIPKHRRRKNWSTMWSNFTKRYYYR